MERLQTSFEDMAQRSDERVAALDSHVPPTLEHKALTTEIGHRKGCCADCRRHFLNRLDSIQELEQVLRSRHIGIERGQGALRWAGLVFAHIADPGQNHPETNLIVVQLVVEPQFGPFALSRDVECYNSVLDSSGPGSMIV
jgi:hypothetical protein